MRTRFQTFIFLASTGVLLGVLFAYVSLHVFDPSSQIRSFGKWHALTEGASEKSGMWNRAWIALHGPMALSSQEALYLGRTKDENGEPFRENCVYRVTGPRPLSQWWSVTIYDEEEFLPDASGTHSISSLQNGDSINFLIGKSQELSTEKAGNFSLILRLYLPGDFDMINVPVVEKVKCEG